MRFDQIFLSLILTSFQYNKAFGDPEIQLPNGRIRGRIGVTGQNTTYYLFAKIPYAAAPVGTLRFQPPVPPSNWNGTLDATSLNVSCYQQSGTVALVESEDCLFINVVTPQLPSDNQELLPVLFFIHGGSWTEDSSIRYINSDGITDNGVILVTFNYRLGVFGFLSTEDNVISGNNGLKDQKLALLWTHQNIALFGGDPDKITIYGQSAGAMSCGYHLLHQSYNGIFRGAILESGSALTPMAYQRGARQRAFDFGSHLNPLFMLTRNSNRLLTYLQSVKASRLKDTSSTFYTLTAVSNLDLDTFQGEFWGPVLENDRPGAFITNKPYKQLLDGTTARVPLLIGFNSEEALSLAQLGVLQNLLLLYFDVRVDLLVPTDMKVNQFEKFPIGNAIREIYLGMSFFNLLAFNPCDGIRYLSEQIFTRSNIRFAEMFSNFSDTYLYQFSYDGILGGLNASCPGADNVGHSENLNYMFCAYPNCNLTDYPESDQVTAKRLSKMWTNFAKTLNPTPDASPLLQNITWPLVSRKTGDFLYLNINETLEIKNHPKNDTYPEWVELYNSLDNQDFDTY